MHIIALIGHQGRAPFHPPQKLLAVSIALDIWNQLGAMRPQHGALFDPPQLTLQAVDLPNYSIAVNLQASDGRRLKQVSNDIVPFGDLEFLRGGRLSRTNENPE